MENILPIRGKNWSVLHFTENVYVGGVELYFILPGVC
jgi:hypothetical protein